MAVFQAAVDDSAGKDRHGTFMMGGFVAPVSDWTDWFTPAWDDRVLKGPPRLSDFHTTDIKSARGRRKLGITSTDAERRVSEAVRVIRSMGSLEFICFSVDEGRFRKITKGMQIAPPTLQPSVFPMEPDYTCGLLFVYQCLQHVYLVHPEATKVDFVFEKKQDVTRRFGQFYDRVPELISKMPAWQHLVPLMGQFIPGDKDRAPLQATDCMCWHIQTVGRNSYAPIDAQRLGMMSSKVVAAGELSEAFYRNFPRRAKRNSIPDPRKKAPPPKKR